jgi:hypothetical protein
VEAERSLDWLSHDHLILHFRLLIHMNRPCSMREATVKGE